MDYQVDDYVEGSGTMQYAYDAFDGVAETKRVLSVGCFLQNHLPPKDPRSVLTWTAAKTKI